MKRLFIHFREWEDIKYGLYSSKNQGSENVAESACLLKDIKNLEVAMKRVFVEWPVSTKVNITNSSKNQRAWLGQAACCLNHGSNEEATKKAWNSLNEREQNAANDIADLLITTWRNEYAKDIS